jgi:hypothetical protein
MLVDDEGDDEPFSFGFEPAPELSDAERERIMRQLEESPMSELVRAKPNVTKPKD